MACAGLQTSLVIPRVEYEAGLRHSAVGGIIIGASRNIDELTRRPDTDNILGQCGDGRNDVGTRFILFWSSFSFGPGLLINYLWTSSTLPNGHNLTSGSFSADIGCLMTSRTPAPPMGAVTVDKNIMITILSLFTLTAPILI